MPVFVRIILTVFFIVATFVLPFFGYWIWAFLPFIISLLGVVTYFRNEKILIGMYFLQKQNIEKAKKWLGKINPTRELRKRQLGYYFLIMGMSESSTNFLQAERFFRKSLNSGLKGNQNIAMAKLGLAGAAISKRSKREAINLISQVKKLDKNKLLAEQIKFMNQQLKKI